MSVTYGSGNRKITVVKPPSPSGSGNRKTLSLKLMIDKKRDKVIYAESDRDFIDSLFSILTLPIGTVLKLLGSDSKEIGSMVPIYNSVASLEPRLLNTVFCKEMLLKPRNASDAQCSQLKLRFDSSTLEDFNFYFCRLCYNRSNQNQFSTFRNARCRKGHLMDAVITDQDQSNLGDGEDDGVFVKVGPATFMISDDLQVMSGSTAYCISLFQKLGINDGSEVEERTVEIGEKEVLRLLKFSLLSKSTLTEALLANQGNSRKDTVKNFEQKKVAQEENATTSNSNSISLKLIISKSQKRVLYAEAGVDVVDFLFSFLTFPLGSIVQLLGRNSSLGCIDELYKSVENLSNANYIKSEKCKKMLVSPKLAPCFSCDNQPLHIEEASYLYSSDDFVIMDPKSPTGKSCSANGFMKGPATFMLTDDLAVTPLSTISSVAIFNHLKVPINDVEERAVTMDKDGALNLLKASLLSKTALSDVFYRRESFPEPLQVPEEMIRGNESWISRGFEMFYMLIMFISFRLPFCNRTSSS